MPALPAALALTAARPAIASTLRIALPKVMQNVVKGASLEVGTKIGGQAFDYVTKKFSQWQQSIIRTFLPLPKNDKVAMGTFFGPTNAISKSCLCSPIFNSGLSSQHLSFRPPVIRTHNGWKFQATGRERVRITNRFGQSITVRIPRNGTFRFGGYTLSRHGKHTLRISDYYGNSVNIARFGKKHPHVSHINIRNHPYTIGTGGTGNIPGSGNTGNVGSGNTGGYYPDSDLGIPSEGGNTTDVESLILKILLKIKQMQARHLRNLGQRLDRAHAAKAKAIGKNDQKKIASADGDIQKINLQVQLAVSRLQELSTLMASVLKKFTQATLALVQQ